MLLPAAHRAIVEDGDAGHVRQRCFTRNVPPAFANDQGDFAFVVKRLGCFAQWQLEPLAVAHNGVVLLGKNDDVLRVWRRHALQRVFLAVVDAHADNFVLGGQRWQQAQLFKLKSGGPASHVLGQRLGGVCRQHRANVRVARQKPCRGFDQVVVVDDHAIAGVRLATEASNFHTKASSRRRTMAAMTSL